MKTAQRKKKTEHKKEIGKETTWDDNRKIIHAQYGTLNFNNRLLIYAGIHTFCQRKNESLIVTSVDG